jgi:dienelactone hydrolase
MKRAVLLLLLLSCRPATPGPPAQDRLAALASEIVSKMASGDLAGVVAHFDAKMKEVMPAEKLRVLWSQLQEGAGAWKGAKRRLGKRQGAYEIVVLTLEFARSSIDARFVFNAAGELAGLFFNMVGTWDDSKPPPYADPRAFQEKSVTVGSEWPLPGILSLPRGDGSVPAVVLVHGSGAHDGDESIGPNKPFRDLAFGLASRGIAVLRYAKRNWVHGPRLARAKPELTVRDETIEDALLAVALLRKTPRIDASRIFVLGHSLGAYLAPRIGAGDPKIAGFILLAGNTRPIEVLLPAQAEYILTVQKAPAEEKAKRLEALRAEIARMQDPALTPQTPGLLGMPGSYWIDLRGYDPAQAAKALGRPLLILQGGRDYQVTIEDFAGWKKTLAGVEKVELRLYPALNHLFLEGVGPSTPAEYERAGNIPVQVIDDIAGWIKK